jgi:hypothetical protein
VKKGKIRILRYFAFINLICLVYPTGGEQWHALFVGSVHALYQQMAALSLFFCFFRRGYLIFDSNIVKKRHFQRGAELVFFRQKLFLRSGGSSSTAGIVMLSGCKLYLIEKRRKIRLMQCNAKSANVLAIFAKR